MTQLSSMASGLNPPGVSTLMSSVDSTPSSSLTTGGGGVNTPTTTAHVTPTPAPSNGTTAATTATNPHSNSSFGEDSTLATTVSSLPRRESLSLRRNRAPILHVFGHVHAQQYEEELPSGPRFCADGTTGMLFLNCAAERKVRVRHS